MSLAATRPDPHPVFAGIETGGTKILCRVVDAQGAILADTRFSTGAPEAAVDAIAACVAPTLTEGRVLQAVGVAAFGPLVLDPASPDHGRLLATTKPLWSGFDLRDALVQRLGAPVVIDTDVNAAALAEQRSGAARGLHTAAYLTVGTGIGGGLAVDGRTLKGALHPEIGHLGLSRRTDDVAISTCRFHPCCAEGLAAGPALQRRLQAAANASERAQALDLEADYLAQLCEMVVLAWSPQRIVMGGGVMHTPGLIAPIHDKLRRRFSAFGPVRHVSADGFLSPPRLADPGLCGAVDMAMAAGRSKPGLTAT